jgi:hypothetical protein
VTKPATGGLKALGLGIALLASAAVYAVDGVILIDQNRALSGNVTPGDAPGFPVTITQPGSYRLSSNLIVPDANTSAIRIAADHITLDLNGFAILGPVDCSGGNCFGLGNGSGVEGGAGGVHFNITIRNGTIQGMGGSGVELRGDSIVVEHLNVRSNGRDGISIGNSQDAGASIARYNTADRNGQNGIVVSIGLVTHNTVSVNLNHGIGVDQGTVSYNFVNRNSRFGLILAPAVNYFGNNLNQNGVLIDSGVNQGQNLCNGAPCPGAQL